MAGKKSEVRKVVLDVLKPHEPSIPDLARTISDVKGVEGVNISVYEIDRKVENVKVTIEGKLGDLNKVRDVILNAGGTIHSIDEVAVGRRMVEEEPTLHDRKQES